MTLRPQRERAAPARAQKGSGADNARSAQSVMQKLTLGIYERPPKTHTEEEQPGAR
jgi:hypothetical protein